MFCFQVGSVLIFVTRKANSVELQANLKARDFKGTSIHCISCSFTSSNSGYCNFVVGLLHGDMSQTERNDVINAFKKQEMPILVATDVAGEKSSDKIEKSFSARVYSDGCFIMFVARGLDIPHIRTVVNFDIARDIDTHTHRVGRTGRAGLFVNIRPSSHSKS